MKPIYRSIGSYMSRIIASGPILYYPLNEKSGAVAKNWGSLGAAANGTYTGVSLRSAPGPKGDAAPYWDGINDRFDFYSAALAAAFTGVEATVAVWAKVVDSHIWPEAELRRVLQATTATGEYIYIYKPSDYEGIRLEWKSGGAYKGTSNAAYNFDTWLLYAMTHSQANTRTRFYINGNVVADQGAGVWGGPLISPAQLGAIGGVSVWDGYLAHFAMWERELSQPELQALYQ